MRGAIGRRPPRPPGVSCPASALPPGPLEQPGLLGVLGPSGVGGPGGAYLLGCTASPRGGSGRLLLGLRVAGRLRRGAPGVRGMPRGPPCPLLEDRGGRLLVVHRGGGLHRVPGQVFQARPACVVLVCTKGAFCWLGGPPCQGEWRRLSDGALRRCVEGHVGQRNFVWRQRAAWGRCIDGSCRGRGSETLDGVALRVCLRPLLPVRGADLAVGLAPPLHVVEGLLPVVHCGWDRQPELLVGGGCRCRPQPWLCCLGVVLQADLEQEGVVFALPQRLDDHASAVRHADYGLGPRRCSGSQTAMCASNRLNMQTTHCGLCCPRWATARVAAGRACVFGPAWRSGTSVALMAFPCHAARRCSSWSALHTSAGGLAQPGSCPLLGALTMCSRTASGQGSAVHTLK